MIEEGDLKKSPFLMSTHFFTLNKFGSLKNNAYICINKIKVFIVMAKENLNRIKELMGLNENLVSINESTLNRIIQMHNKNGFIIISAYRGDKSPSENRKNHLELMQDVKNNGFSFTKVFGGFIENKGTDEEREVKEPSLFIPNFPIGERRPFESTDKIYAMGVELSKKYEQDSFLFKDKDGSPKYITKDGDVDMDFSGDFIINKPEMYFTSVSKNNNGRFTFTEAYVVEPPKTINERISKLKKIGEEYVSWDTIRGNRK